MFLASSKICLSDQVNQQHNIIRPYSVNIFSKSPQQFVAKQTLQQNESTHTALNKFLVQSQSAPVMNFLTNTLFSLLIIRYLKRKCPFKYHLLICLSILINSYKKLKVKMSLALQAETTCQINFKFQCQNTQVSVKVTHGLGVFSPF